MKHAVAGFKRNSLTFLFMSCFLYHEITASYAAAFAIPAILLIIATAVFTGGRYSDNRTVLTVKSFIHLQS